MITLLIAFPQKMAFSGGKISKPFCYGKGKVDLARDWLDGRDMELDDCYFYTDSYSDLPMLLEVGNPRVVNPDPKLKRYSKRKNWSVLDCAVAFTKILTM